MGGEPENMGRMQPMGPMIRIHGSHQSHASYRSHSWANIRSNALHNRQPARKVVFCAGLLLVLMTAKHALAQSATAAPLTPEQKTELKNGLKEVTSTLAAQTSKYRSDAAIFAKGLFWALKYDSQFTPADVAMMRHAISRGHQRGTQLSLEKKPSWVTRRGKVVLGYQSRVDGSDQSYGLMIPQQYESTKPIRLDVVLHGSTRPVGLSELRFMARFDEGDDESDTAIDQQYLELHPLGRVENCYRWAGETDVFEAIEDVCHRYNVDRSQIVLRGMSMGASGTWHLGLKHPDRFAALGPYCGYVDTHQFSETPLPNFVKVGPLPRYQELGLHMLDSVDYAANAGIVPAVACMGEKDIFFDAHVLMGQAMQREGLTMTNLISPGTGHVIDPVTFAEQMKQIAVHVQRRRNQAPTDLRFVTWTLKYSGSHWLQMLRLRQHYARAELSGRWRDQQVEIDEPQNVVRFAIHGDWGRDSFGNPAPRSAARHENAPASVRIGDVTIPIPTGRQQSSGSLVFSRSETWQLDDATTVPAKGKRPGLQGPIDDAFTSAFLCVRGTGRPWNDNVQDYADHSLKRFADEWHHYFRGELPVKDDSAVTETDLRTRNLILFGDPGSNSWIAKALPSLPILWTKETLQIGTEMYGSNDHVPALIFPNPLPGAGERYIVLNSGHTFRDAELNKLNYLLFPRLGDWAILTIGQGSENDSVVRAGFFDEDWAVNLKEWDK